MKKYDKKVTSILAEQWNGGQGEGIIHVLRDLGYTACFQKPRPDAKDADDDGNEIQAKDLLVVVSRWNWEITYVEPSEYIRIDFYKDSGEPFDVDVDDFQEATDAVKAGLLNVSLSTIKHRYLAREYDI